MSMRTTRSLYCIISYSALGTSQIPPVPITRSSRCPQEYLLRRAGRGCFKPKFCSKALVWNCLRYPYIVPLIGIDTESFPSSVCMASPWMKNRNALKYLSGIGKAHMQNTVNRLVFYIHRISQ
ncbi:hypothetical protein DFH09DRAFT_1054154 [Mycena vulgaris]|nr:hypothetical protein DFH09DRAFT_1054154 [Mycena vulgaris]